MLTSAWVHEHAHEFDLMHIHFGFDAVSPQDLTELVTALRAHAKPLVLTVHDLRNPHHRTVQMHDAQLGVLVGAADHLITLTSGAASVIAERWGRTATVLPHPHVAPRSWIERPRSRNSAFVVGLHAKSLRANMDPATDLDAVLAAFTTMPGAVLRVDVHTDVMSPGFPRHDPAFSAHLRDLEDRGRIDLRVHDYFTDEQLWEYLQGLDASVLPYRFGTHSGWLEACHDLGTWVIAPDCGFYAEQHPVHSYRADGPQRSASLTQAVRDVYQRSVAGEHAPRPTWRDRSDQRVRLAAAHARIYSDQLCGELSCTS